MPFVLLAAPFYVLYRVIGFALRAVGRLCCAALGLVLMAAGVALSLTIVGAVAGLPLAAFGVLLMARALF